MLLNLLVADGKAADLDAAAAFAATQTEGQIADYLRAKDAKTILTTVLAKGLTVSGPIPDGTVVPADPIAALAAGQLHEGADGGGRHARRGQALRRVPRRSSAASRASRSTTRRASR